ncbi:MAG: DUF4286 family protein [Rhodothermales bacterium]|nr:DUF4286 family protein [Rhodothermales bacterium]
MIIYEVNLTVQPEIADAYAAWLAAHVREMLTFDGFEAAEWLEDAEAEGPARRWTVQYRVRSPEHLRRYFDAHAERMRGEGVERFGGRFSATRRILRMREAFAEAGG